MRSAKTDIWTAVLESIETDVGHQRFSLWFRNVRPVTLDESSVTLGVPNLFVQDWLQSHFETVLREKFAAQMGSPPAIHFVIEPELFQQSRNEQLKSAAEIVEEAAAAEKKAARNPSDPAQQPIRSDFTLKNFIVGAHNKLAVACAMETVDSAANNFNPLFIHSLSGLGKTHLMQAMLHAVNARGDGRKAEYVSAEMFTNQFIYAMRTHRLDAFRNRYRNADILLVDDVHFFNNKNGLQEELLHTFDALDAGRRQLVLASDVHPKLLNKIKQSLLSRFAAGMVVRIVPPDFSARVLILKAKLSQQRRAMPEEVIRYVARGFEGSVRDLCGAITLILAYASLTGEKIDVALARKALEHHTNHFAPRCGMGAVERVVAEQYGIAADALRGRRMKRAWQMARHICMYLGRKCTSMSCREIAQHFGAANHSSVVFSASKVEQLIAKDRDFKELVFALEEKIRKN